MARLQPRPLAGLSLALGLSLLSPGLALTPARARAQEPAAAGAARPVEAILKDLEATKVPKLDPALRDDQAALRKFYNERMEATQKRAALSRELFQADPNHPRLAELLPERWASIPPVGPRADELLQEIAAVLAGTQDPKLKVEGSYTRAQILLMRSRMQPDAKPDLSGVEAFVAAAPGDPRASRLLYMATQAVSDPETKAALEARILKEFADSPFAGMIQGARRQREGLGKPFELEFQEATRGTTVAMKDLKGKVVVIDFWATWCGPCIAEMPKMKKLYAEYKDKGVEFIGVSLDQPKEKGGLDKLKEYVAKNEILWPQYYQGNYWDSEFSRSWGINAIPCVFLVDQQGNLVSTEARGKLETLIPELLGKAKPAGEQ